MTDNNNIVTDTPSEMSESEKLAASIQDMIFAAVSSLEEEAALVPVTEEPAEEPIEEVADEPIQEPEITAEPEVTEVPEVIEEPEVAEESEVTEEPEIIEEPVEEVPTELPEISEELPPADEAVLENIGSGISRIAVVCPSGKEDTEGVEGWLTKEFPDAEIYSVKGTVNADDLIENCGVVIAVKLKVTTYGAYRKAVKMIKKSQAKILGAVIV